jgi:hypothetical protein
VFAGVFIAEEVDGVQDKGSGETTTAEVQTLLEPSLNLSLRSACFTDKALFLVKSKPYGLVTVLLYCQINSVSKVLDIKLKEFAVFRTCHHCTYANCKWVAHTAVRRLQS